MATRKWFVCVFIVIINISFLFAQSPAVTQGSATTIIKPTTATQPQTTTVTPTTDALPVTTRGVAPEPVTTLKKGVITSATIELQWPASSGANHYSVEYRLTDKYQCGSIPPGVRTRYGDVIGLSVLVVGLSSYSTYEFFVIAVNDWGTSGETKTSAMTNEIRNSAREGAPTGVMLLSRSATSLSFEWNSVSCEQFFGPVDEYRGELSPGIPPQYLTTMDTMLTFYGLIPCRSYEFKVAGMGRNIIGPYSDLTRQETDVAEPGKVSSLIVTSTSNQIDLIWQPPAEESDCQTDYLVEYRLLNIGQCDAQPPNPRFVHHNITSDLQTTIGDLRAYSTYQVRVKARYNLQNLGDSYTSARDTLDQAPSSAPSNITLLSKSSTSLEYMFNELQCEDRNGVITGYTCVLENPSMPGVYRQIFVTGLGVNFTGLLPATEYTVRIAANSSIGVIGPFSARIQDSTDNEQPTSIVGIIAGAAVGLLVAVIIVAVIVIGWKRGWITGVNKPGKTNSSSHKPKQDVLGLDIPLPAISPGQFHINTRFISDDDVVYEVPVPRKPAPTLPRKPQRGIVPWAYFVISEQEIGKGAFGKVYAGHIWSERLQEWNAAAIKVLKAGSPVREEKAFQDEFKTMQRIGYHKNVVSLLAAATNNEGIFHVGIEFAVHGNLRKYLRDYRKSGKTILNHKPKQAGDDLTLKEIMTFAHEVTKGMLHLLDKQIIHRDLAARNVLLGDEGGIKVAKVADFGLARDEDYGTANSRVKLPTRWLAIESIRFRKFSTESDVWAYGILLYEMITLGVKPYPGIDNKDIIIRLEEGYRMEQPDGCDDDIYHLMTSCWQKDPKMRPSFVDLEKSVKRKLDKADVVYANL